VQDTLVSVKVGLAGAEANRDNVREARAALLERVVQGTATDAELDELPSDADLGQAVADAETKVAAAKRLAEEATQNVATVARDHRTDVLLHADKLDDQARRKAQAAYDRLVTAEAALRDAEALAEFLQGIASGKVIQYRPVQHVAAQHLAALDERINGAARQKDSYATATAWLSTDDNFSRVLPPLAAASIHKDLWTPGEVAASLGIDVDTFRRAYAEVKRRNVGR
jgi:hypothetical protein